jgi:hypothetical protein
MTSESNSFIIYVSISFVLLMFAIDSVKPSCLYYKNKSFKLIFGSYKIDVLNLFSVILSVLVFILFYYMKKEN